MFLNKDFTTTFFEVNGGDGIWIRFKDNEGAFRNILIDGGYVKCYRTSFQQVISLMPNAEIIDLWIITHIDKDHIGGVLAFIEDSTITRNDLLNVFWFNHPEIRIHLASQKISVRQGIKLRQYLEQRGQVQEAITSLNRRSLYNASIIILSPQPEKLLKANQDWVLEEESRVKSSAKSIDHDFVIEELIGGAFKEDEDLTNGSSIAFIFKYGAISSLFLADAHPSDIVESLRGLGYSAANKLSVAFTKIAHHGSKGNTSSELLDLLDCQKFIFCANGISHFHPDKETLVKILTHSERDMSKTISFAFTADTQELRKMFNVDQEPFRKYNFKMEFPESGLTYYQY